MTIEFLKEFTQIDWIYLNYIDLRVLPNRIEELIDIYQFPLIFKTKSEYFNWIFFYLIRLIAFIFALNSHKFLSFHLFLPLSLKILI